MFKKKKKSGQNSGVVGKPHQSFNKDSTRAEVSQIDCLSSSGHSMQEAPVQSLPRGPLRTELGVAYKQWMYYE